MVDSSPEHRDHLLGIVASYGAQEAPDGIVVQAGTGLQPLKEVRPLCRAEVADAEAMRAELAEYTGCDRGGVLKVDAHEQTNSSPFAHGGEVVYGMDDD